MMAGSMHNEEVSCVGSPARSAGRPGLRGTTDRRKHVAQAAVPQSVVCRHAAFMFGVESPVLCYTKDAPVSAYAGILTPRTSTTGAERNARFVPIVRAGGQASGECRASSRGSIARPGREDLKASHGTLVKQTRRTWHTTASESSRPPNRRCFGRVRARNACPNFL
jgi:hypothetical protein